MSHDWATAYLYFWAGVSTRAQDLHLRFGQNYFPRWFDSRRTGITACQVWEMISDAEKSDPKIFVSSKIAGAANPRDIRHFQPHGSHEAEN